MNSVHLALELNWYDEIIKLNDLIRRYKTVFCNELVIRPVCDTEDIAVYHGRSHCVPLGLSLMFTNFIISEIQLFHSGEGKHTKRVSSRHVPVKNTVQLYEWLHDSRQKLVRWIYEAKTLHLFQEFVRFWNIQRDVFSDLLSLATNTERISNNW